MKATATKAYPTPKGLRLQAALELSPGGPIRFLGVVVPWEVLTAEHGVRIANEADRRARAAEADQDELPLDWV